MTHIADRVTNILTSHEGVTVLQNLYKVAHATMSSDSCFAEAS